MTSLSPDPSISKTLSEYDQSRNPALLKEAANAAALHNGELAPDATIGRQRALARLADWIAILTRVKRDLDPQFDPFQPPSQSIVPPGKFGNQYAPGVAPKDVKDPQMRADYIKAIEENNERIRNFSANAKMFKLHGVLSEAAITSILDAHHTLGMPVADIVAIVSAADILEADRADILAAVTHS